MQRRDFLKTAGSAAGAVALSSPALAAPAETHRVAGMPYRTLGRTGAKVSTIAFPGLALVHYPQDECTAGLHKAFERGVNYFDVAPAYGNGECEKKMGIGLEGLDRSKYFLACKTKKRDKAGAREELERSLKLLKTDHFELYQIHHLRRNEEVEQIFAPGGAMETLVAARKEGIIKYLGFSAHTTRGAIGAMKRFEFDTVMFPISFYEYMEFGFGKEVIELAEKQGAAVLAIKALSRGGWPKGVEKTRKWWYRSMEEPGDIGLALRFTLSLPQVVSAFTPSFLDLLDRAITAAGLYQPISPAEIEQLKAIAKTCEPVFQKEEVQTTWRSAPAGPLFADSPHECPGEHC